MNLLTAFVLTILTGHSGSLYVQELICPYEAMNSSQTRIWCKRDVPDENCCTGFAFRPNIKELEDGKIKIRDDGKSFTVSVQTLTQGDGMYWCGLMADDKTIVKLAEDYFSIAASLNFSWSILRWIIFLLLCLMFISIYIYSNRKHKDEQPIYEDIMMKHVKE